MNATMQSTMVKFDVWWKYYPRKVDKGHARKAFVKIDPDDDLMCKMLTALEWQRKSDDWTKDMGKWIPYPATYLNGERWDDQPTIEVKPVRREIVYRCYHCGRQKRESEMTRHPTLISERVCTGGCRT